MSSGVLDDCAYGARFQNPDDHDNRRVLYAHRNDPRIKFGTTREHATDDELHRFPLNFVPTQGKPDADFRKLATTNGHESQELVLRYGEVLPATVGSDRRGPSAPASMMVTRSSLE